MSALFVYDHPGDLFRIEEREGVRYWQMPFVAEENTPAAVKRRMKRNNGWRCMLRVKSFRLLSNRVKAITYHPEVLAFGALKSAVAMAEELSGEKVQINRNRRK